MVERHFIQNHHQSRRENTYFHNHQQGKKRVKKIHSHQKIGAYVTCRHVLQVRKKSKLFQHLLENVRKKFKLFMTPLKDTRKTIQILFLTLWKSSEKYQIIFKHILEKVTFTTMKNIIKNIFVPSSILPSPCRRP